MKHGFGAGVPLLVLLSGCGPTEPDCPDICSIWAEVRGEVRLTSGAPVSNARVDMELMWGTRAAGGEVTCETSTGAPRTQVASGSDGEFSGLLQGLSIHPAHCVELTVTPPSGQDLSTVVDTLTMAWSREKATPAVIEATIVLRRDSLRTGSL